MKVLTRHPLGALALSAALGLTGCMHGSDTSAVVIPLLEQAEAAPDVVPHRGTRHFMARTVGVGGSSVVEYTEEIAMDGTGCFSVVPLEVISAAGDAETFLSLQEIRQNFVQRYRDFRIRDRQLLLSNYLVQLPDTVGVEVAGREAYQLTLDSKLADDGRRYEVALDTETFLVLRYREIADDGTLLTSMEYLTYSADPGAIDCFESDFEENVIGEVLPTEAELGFEPMIPSALPPGYAFEETGFVNDPFGESWLKLSYTDGIEALFFLQRMPHSAPEGPLERGTIQASSPQSFAVEPSDSVPDATGSVLIYDAGGVAAIQGRVNGSDVIAVGKVSRDDLFVLLDSSL